MRRLVLLLPLLAACAEPLAPREHTAVLVQNLTNLPLAIALHDATGTTPGATLAPLSRGCYAIVFRGQLQLIATVNGQPWTTTIPTTAAWYQLDFNGIANQLRPLAYAPC